MEHIILFTRTGEPATNAIVKLCTPDEVSGAVAFDRFHRGMHLWLTTTAPGEEDAKESSDDFNIGDMLTSGVAIPGDDDFNRILLE